MLSVRRSSKALVLLSCLAGVGIVLTSRAAGQPARAPAANAELETVRITPNFYMIVGAGANVGVQFGPDGAVLVDGGTLEAADRVVAAIKRITDQPIRYIIDTCADPDHIGGTGKLSKAGRGIYATGPEPLGGEFGRDLSPGTVATILATQNLLLRVSAPTGKTAQFTNDVWPTETFAPEERKYVYFNREGIQVAYQPAAHDGTDSIVFFRASDVIAAGEIIDASHFPVIDINKGGSIQGEIAALNHIIELSVRPLPFAYQVGGTYIMPGHGRVYQQIDVVEYRDMLVIVTDIIQDMIKRGMTLDQITAASPAKAYARQYGSDSGPWTTNNFVQAVYQSLTKEKAPRKAN